MNEEEKVYLYSLLRKYEKFCGVEIEGFCLMTNHFHLLLRVPPRPLVVMGDAEFFEKLCVVYSADVVGGLQKLVEEVRVRQSAHVVDSEEFLQDEAIVADMKAPYLKRMWDLSEFMKVVKQRFTRWYNRKHGKSGTLWEGRFKSQIVESGHSARMVAAYIDLNPVRAGIVTDPKDYRWSSYGEAIAGGKRAQSGLLSVMNRHSNPLGVDEDELLSWKDVRNDYRVILAEEGVAVAEDEPPVEGKSASKRYKKRYGFSRKQADEIIANGGKLSMGQLLRCRSRYFSDGLVIGSKEYVDKVFLGLKKQTGGYERRSSGARKIRNLESQEAERMYTMRDLVKN